VGEAMNGNPIVMVKGMGLFEAVPLQSLLSGAQVAPQQLLVPKIAFAIIKDSYSYETAAILRF
jgi:hypothetical protein